MIENRLQAFFYEENEVRTVVRDDEIWFVLADVCSILELSNPSMITDRLDDDEKAKVDPKQYLGSRSNEPITVISESGLYNVIFLSRKPEAKAFKRWITHDVLPAIRRHGLYISEQLLADNERLKAEIESYKAEKLQLALFTDWLTVDEFKRASGKRINAHTHEKLCLACSQLNMKVRYVSGGGCPPCYPVEAYKIVFPDMAEYRYDKTARFTGKMPWDKRSDI